MADILIAGTDANSCEVLRLECEGQGFSTDLALDGYEAGEAVLATHPRMLIVEPGLSIVSTSELCIQLREHPDVPENFPIILLSDDPQNAKELEAMGVTDLLLKSHAAPDVRELLTHWAAPDTTLIWNQGRD